MGKSLTLVQRQNFLGILITAYPTVPEFELLVDTRLGLVPANISPLLGLNVRFNDLINLYKNRADVLIDTVLNDPKQSNNLALQAILNDIRANLIDDEVGLVVTDPFKACLVAGTIPFIDRVPYRTKLEDLFKSKKKFLVVNGPPQSGKSHSYFLVYEIAEKYGHKFSYITLANEIPSTYYPNDLARQIDADLALPSTEPMPSPQNMGEQYVRELFDWLVKKVNLDNTRSWIVLDGFDHPDLRPETRDFVFKLIQGIKGLRLKEVRLVLLDYPSLLNRLTQDVKIFVHSEELQYFDEPEVKSYFELFFEQANITADSSQIDAQAQEIFQQLPADLKIEERLSMIMERVMERALALLPDL